VPVLAIDDVSLAFHRGRRHLVSVLTDASLQVCAGEVVSVLAQRAQGKTSLLRVAAGIQRPNRGRVFVAGQDLWELTATRRARLLSAEIGWAGHGAPDLDVPMLTSVAMPLLATCTKRQAYARAAGALERVGALPCAEQSWGSLADWERALVALAHGIVRQPRLMLVDDVTMSLGLEEADDATQLLASLAKERSIGVLMCVSDAKATSWSQRVLRLAGGELSPSAPPASPMGTLIDFPTETARRAFS
jgi:lipoprotein-releasing system ATP-binding protein